MFCMLWIEPARVPQQQVACYGALGRGEEPAMQEVDPQKWRIGAVPPFRYHIWQKDYFMFHGSA